MTRSPTWPPRRESRFRCVPKCCGLRIVPMSTCVSRVEDRDLAALAGMVRARRRAAGLSQEDLAGLAGVSVGAVRDLEQGRTIQPHTGTVERLIRAFDLYPAEAAAMTRMAQRTTSAVARLGGVIR